MLKGVLKFLKCLTALNLSDDKQVLYFFQNTVEK